MLLEQGKVWIQSKAEYFLHLWYAEVRKSALQSWTNFGYKLDSNYWQPSGFFAAKHTVLLDPSRTKMVSYSAIETVLADGEYISKKFQT